MLEKNDDTESLLRLKTTKPNLSHVKKRQYRTFLILNTEQKRRYRRKGFRRFWLEKTDNTDNFLCLKTEDFSTRAITFMDHSIVSKIRNKELAIDRTTAHHIFPKNFCKISTKIFEYSSKVT